MPRYELLTGPAGLEDARTRWEDLANRSRASYFQTYAFAHAWYETLGQRAHASPRIVVLSDGDRAIGVFPACVVRLHGIPVVTWMGIPDAQDCGDALFDGTQTLVSADEFVDQSLSLLRKQDPLCPWLFLNVPDGGVASRVFESRMHGRRRGIIPIIDTSGDFEEYSAHLSRRRRANMRKCLNRLNTDGPYRFDSYLIQSEEGARRLDELFALKVRQRAEAGLPSELASESYRMFCQLHCECEPQGVVSVLLLNDRMIAGLYEIEYRDERIGVLTAYDPEYSRYSPGLTAEWLTIQRCFADGTRDYNLGWGADAYKYYWNPREVQLTMYVNRGPVGRLLAAAATSRDRKAARSDEHEAVRRGVTGEATA